MSNANINSDLTVLFNVDARTGYGFAILMASVDTLRPTGSGAS